MDHIRVLDAARGRGLRLRRAVFVATPNAGTALADAAHMVAFVDRYTSILNLVPPGPLDVVTEVLEVIVTAAKVIGHALLRGLPGLLAMDPRGDLIGRINAVGAPTAQHHALAANDLVVPTLGVSQGSADPAFPIADDRVFNYTTSAGVLHTSFFGKPETSARLLSWLPG